MRFWLKLTRFWFPLLVVSVDMSSSPGVVKEGEGYWICVSLSRSIARQITLLLQVQPDTADLCKYILNSSIIKFYQLPPNYAADLEMTSIPVTFSPSSELRQCVQIVAAQDNVIEEDEAFRIQLSLQTILPGSLSGHLVIPMPSTTIIIQDTSKWMIVYVAGKIKALSCSIHRYMHWGQSWSIKSQVSCLYSWEDNSVFCLQLVCGRNIVEYYIFRRTKMARQEWGKLAIRKPSR